MENWGLITGRTSVFLLDPKRSDLKAKKRVATVQSHEVAHMWFGNITTMEWWNYLYLNEGFATLVCFRFELTMYFSVSSLMFRWEKLSFLVRLISFPKLLDSLMFLTIDKQVHTALINQICNLTNTGSSRSGDQTRSSSRST